MDGKNIEQAGDAVMRSTVETITGNGTGQSGGGENLAQQVDSEHMDFVPPTREQVIKEAGILLKQVEEGKLTAEEASKILKEKAYGPQEAESKKDETRETQSQVEKKDGKKRLIAIAKEYLDKRLSELSDEISKMRKEGEEDIQLHGLTAEQARQDAENEQKKVREVLHLLKSSNPEEAEEGLNRAKELVGAYYQESVIAKNLVERGEAAFAQTEEKKAETADEVIDKAETQEARVQEEEGFEKEHADLRETAADLEVDVEELDKLEEEKDLAQLFKVSAEVNHVLGRENLAKLSLEKAIQILKVRGTNLERLIETAKQAISESESGGEQEPQGKEAVREETAREEKDKKVMSREKKIQLLKTVGKGVGIFILLILISAAQEARQ